MAITSYGYAGTIAANAPWALMQYALGQEYFVLDEAALRVTPVATGTREVDIAAGYFGGQGILDQNTAPFRLQLPTVASGTRYFLIVARRTWSTTQATSFASIDAGVIGGALPARNTSPGVLDDQPVALVPLTAGQTVPGTPIDLRLVGHAKGSYSAFDRMALSYATRIGTVVRIGNDRWTRIITSSYVATWDRDPGAYARIALPNDSGSGVISTASGWWAASPLVNVGVQNGNAYQLDLQARRTGAAIGTDSHGNLPDSRIGTIATAYRPRRRLILPTLVEYTTTATDRTNYLSGLGLSYLDQSGNWTLTAAMPNVWITAPTDSTVTSVSATVNFLREDKSADVSAGV